MPEPVFVQISSKYQNILTELNKCEQSQIVHFVTNYIQNGKSLEEIAHEFLRRSDYNGICFTDTSSAMFDSFIKYKNGMTIRKEDALYLSARAGFIGQYFDNYELKIVSVIYLIHEIDGNGFFEWMDNLAELDLNE